MEEKQKVVQCYHCGNETLMNIVGSHRETYCEPDGYSIYQTLLCPVCKQITLIEIYWDEFQMDYDESGTLIRYVKTNILFPSTSLKSAGLPELVQSAYEAALKCRNIDTAICLIALRRTLEFVCHDKQATGQNLWRKIEDLSAKGILPSELKHASIITKNYGNMGAHDSQINVSQTDINLIFEFVKYILDYLYVLPAKLKEMQEKMGRPQTNVPDTEENEPGVEIEEIDDA